MRLLIIISQFSPSQTPNTLRWVPLAEHYAAAGHEVSVLTTLHSACPIDEEIQGVKIYRAGHNTLMDRYYNSIKSVNRRNETSARQPSDNPVQGMLQKMVDKTWRNSYWPDGSKLFLKPGITKGLEIIKENEITHLISVGIPFTCHWIAKSLKERNQRVKWHMDIQDPFSYSEEFWVNNFDLHENRNIKTERLTFHLADSISMTNERAKEKYSELFPKYTDKTSVIPPLFHLPKEHEPYDMILFSEKIHLAYFGSFYDGVRSPLMFIKFLKYLHEQDNTLFDKIQFHFIGQMDRKSYPLFSLYPEIRRYMVLHGFKNRAETLDAMSQVDILMNFGNTTDYHLPSKVVDYLYMNKPILNLTSIENDSTQLFMHEHDDIENLLLNKDNFPALAQRFHEFVFKERKETAPRIEAVENYTAVQIAKRYLELIV